MSNTNDDFQIIKDSNYGIVAQHIQKIKNAKLSDQKLTLGFSTSAIVIVHDVRNGLPDTLKCLTRSQCKQMRVLVKEIDEERRFQGLGVCPQTWKVSF